MANLLASSRSLTTFTPRTTSIDRGGDECAIQQYYDGITISRRNLIIALVLIAFTLLASWSLLITFLLRENVRRRRTKAAKQRGRKSRFDSRISMMRKEIDAQFTQQYRGCLQHIPENPEMGSDSPVELMLPEMIWEAPAVPPKTLSIAKSARKSKAISLFFDHAVNLWVPKR